MKNEPKRKSDEWDSREKDWSRRVSSFPLTPRAKPPPKKKKLNPKKRFRAMLVSLTVIIFTVLGLSITFQTEAPSLQPLVLLSSSIISGAVFMGNYGKDIVGAILSSLSKNSLR